LLTWQLAPALLTWMLPVALPMVAAPAIIAWSSRPQQGSLFEVPSDGNPPNVLQLHDAYLADWSRFVAEGPATERTLVNA